MRGQLCVRAQQGAATFATVGEHDMQISLTFCFCVNSCSVSYQSYECSRCAVCRQSTAAVLCMCTFHSSIALSYGGINLLTMVRSLYCPDAQRFRLADYCDSIFVWSHLLPSLAPTSRHATSTAAQSISVTFAALTWSR